MKSSVADRHVSVLMTWSNLDFKSNISKTVLLGTKLLLNTNRQETITSLSNVTTFNDLDWPRLGCKCRHIFGH